MRDKDEIRRLFQQYMANQCTEEERKKLFGYFKSPDAELVLRELIQEQIGNESGMPALDADESRKWVESTFAGVRSRITQAEPFQAEAVRSIRNQRMAYWKVAAVFTSLLLLASALYEWNTSRRMITQTTAFGEIRVVVLPDQSTVTLNGNSTLTYPENWQPNREVWIEGEAYFSVRHTADDRRFVVHPSGQVSVEVLGTEFNVSDRKIGLRVVLNKGSIRLHIPEEHNQVFSSARTGTLLLQPGELVEFTGERGRYTKKIVEASHYSSWKDQKISLDNTSLEEIAMNLQETYGLTVQVSDPRLWTQKVSGSISSESEQRIIQQLEMLFAVTILKEGPVITLHPL